MSDTAEEKQVEASSQYCPRPRSQAIITPYRVMVSGIPLQITSEAFYDYLRAYAGRDHRSVVHNALLLHTPAGVARSNAVDSNSNDDHKKMRMPAAAVGHHHQHNTTNNNTSGSGSAGAAVVDFVSKSAAERVMRIWSSMDGSSNPLSWQPVGPVIAAAGTRAAGARAAALMAYDKGSAAYDAASKRVRHEAPSSTSPHRQLPESTTNTTTIAEDTHDDDKDDIDNDNDNDSAQLIDASTQPLEQTVRLVRMRSDSATTQHHHHYRAAAASTPITSSASPPPTTTLGGVGGDGVDSLFSEISHALRRRALGPLHSLHCLSLDEVHIVVDRYTAHALLHDERRCLTTTTSTTNNSNNSKLREEAIKATSTPSSSSSATTTRTSSLWAVNPFPRPCVPLQAALAVGNVSLASKASVLSAMSRMVARTGGRYGAARDAYGNLFFL